MILHRGETIGRRAVRRPELAREIERHAAVHRADLIGNLGKDADLKAARRWWPLSYAIVWICFRDHQRARAVYGGNQTVDPNTLGIEVSLTRAMHPDLDLIMPMAATGMLLDALRDEQVKASGLPAVSRSTVRDIAAVEWLGMRIAFSNYEEVHNAEGGGGLRQRLRFLR